jgi:two-component system OmpR family sensor kinase
MRRAGMTFSVRVRILASILLVTALGMTIAGGTAYLVQRERVLGQVDSRLNDTANRLRSIARATDYATVTALLTVAIQQITPDTNEGIVGIIDGVPAVVPGSSIGIRLDRETAFATRVTKETKVDGVVIGTALTAKGALRYIAVPVTVTADGSSGIYVAAFSIDAELAPIAQAFGTFALVSSGALVLIAVVGWFVAGRLLRPIRVLRETAERITESDLDERIPVVGRDDISELARTVNAMLDRMQRAIVGQRQLLDDVGHELRTPLTIVRGHLELMEPTEASQVGATRALVIDEVDRMRGLVSDIALLATAIPDQAGTRSPVDISVLTESVFEKVSALPGHPWLLGEVTDAVATIDEARVTQAWLQLAANADRHSTDGAPVEIGSATMSTDEGRRLRMWVRDAGPGIATEAHERIFERFGREGGGRGTTGSGLGLAIVSVIAEAQGGRVLLDSAPGRGSTFTIDLPLGGPG